MTKTFQNLKKKMFFSPNFCCNLKIRCVHITCFSWPFEKYKYKILYISWKVSNIYGIEIEIFAGLGKSSGMHPNFLTFCVGTPGGKKMQRWDRWRIQMKSTITWESVWATRWHQRPGTIVGGSLGLNKK